MKSLTLFFITCVSSLTWGAKLTPPVINGCPYYCTAVIRPLTDSSSRQVSIRNRINVAVDWFKVRFFGRDITRL